MATAWRATVLPLAALACAGAQAADASWWQQAQDQIGIIYREGETDLYVPGYIHHGRNSYTTERLTELNEKNAWGLGLGKTVRNARGNEESIYLLGVNDSHYKMQWMAGYAYQWSAPVAHTPLEASVGLTAQLMSRHDYFGAIPFPLALPLASIGTRGNRLMVSYVPRLSKNKNSGDVLFFFVRLRLD